MTQQADDGPTDAQLIATSIGDPRSFMPVVERHQRVLFGYLARRVGPELAEEITSETFARAFAQRARFNAQWQSARPWLFGIALNLLRHHQRTEVRRLRAYARSGVDPLDSHDGDELVERLDAGRQGAALAAALAELKDGDRDALLLFAWGDLSYEEIGATLGIPVGTVRSRLNRARRQVREALERALPAETAPGGAPAPQGGTP